MMPFDDRNPKKHIKHMIRGPNFVGCQQQLTHSCNQLIKRILDPDQGTRPDCKQILQDKWFGLIPENNTSSEYEQKLSGAADCRADEKVKDNNNNTRVVKTELDEGRQNC